jgi:hypothetical protein
MEILLIVGASVLIIAFAWGVDNGFEIYEEWRSDRKLKKIRASVNDQALRTLTAVMHMKQSVAAHHHHGTHRRVKVSL